MIRFFQILTLILTVTLSQAQNNDTEYWRALGYQAKIKGDYEDATNKYLQVLVIDSTDYDAWLALGRLYALQGEYDTAIDYFSKIYNNDSTDVEAMNGFGKCYMSLGKNKDAIYFFDRALHYLPGEVEQYFYLAKAYSYSGKLNEAIDTYKQVNEIDSTYAEVWAGIGKMYYWKGKPKTAVSFYNRALELDPANEALKKELRQVQKELKFGLTAKFRPLKETEETYEIVALISSLKFEKRLNDHFSIDANVLLDYSNRVFANNIGDTTRWYDASWIKGNWISEHHKVSAYIGYSVSDDLFSTYGLNWKLNYAIGKFKIRNSLNAGYDYFYYWNKVGAHSMTNKLDLSYNKLGFSAFYTYGIVDPVLISDIATETYDTVENPYNAYSFSFSYKLFKNPVITLGISHSYLNYKYKSPLYYSPFERRLTGAFASVYYNFKKIYIYGSFAYNLGTEMFYEESSNGNSGNNGNSSLRESRLNVNNWSTNLEMGYTMDAFIFSIGGSNFYNPFYQNITGFAAIKFIF